MNRIKKGAYPKPPPTVVRITGLASGLAFPKGTTTVVWKVFDAMGRMMWQQRFGSETLTSDEQTRIDLDDRWKAGVYMVVLRTDGQTLPPVFAPPRFPFAPLNYLKFSRLTRVCIHLQD